MDAVTRPPAPRNEPVLTYAPGTPERDAVVAALAEQAADPLELTMTIGGERRMGSGERFDVVAPHRRAQVLGTGAEAGDTDVQAAVDAALAAAEDWRRMPFDERAAILLRAADLLSGPWRARLNAATMLGQSKTVQQAEIDSACELADFWRFNVSFARDILEEQPQSSPGVWNRTDHRPLEGFVLAITPFNFTAIAGNLPTAPALMGNTVVWKPSPTQTVAAYWTMRLLEAAGLPPGVINLVTGYGESVSRVAVPHRELAGIHFTGSTRTFQGLWKSVGNAIDRYAAYPRLVGETGGKDFVLAHPSADVDVTRTALVRGAFEYQGQKCSAASRAYVARSVWDRMRDDLVAETEALTMGPVEDLSNFMGAVIDDRAYAKVSGAVERLGAVDSQSVVVGGDCDDSEGWFIRPTVTVGTDPTDEAFTTEYFGPLLAVHVYDDGDWSRVLDGIPRATPYALTGAVLADDRRAVVEAGERLRFAAGNFYVNDKPTGAVVGQQPFGGGRASGTNDKAGSAANLLRWTSPRSIKETFVPPTSVGYPHQATD